MKQVYYGDGKMQCQSPVVPLKSGVVILSIVLEINLISLVRFDISGPFSDKNPLFTKMPVTSLIMVRFSKFNFSLKLESKPHNIICKDREIREIKPRVREVQY